MSPSSLRAVVNSCGTGQKLYQSVLRYSYILQQASLKEKYRGNTIGVLPRIHHAYQELMEMCKQASLQRSSRDLQFCTQIPLPNYYQGQKRYGLRKAQSYKGKLHKSHVRVNKRKYQHDRTKVKKCKCYICGKEGHFARECRNKSGNKERIAMLKEIDLPEDFDVVYVDQDESKSDVICSMSEGELDTE